MIKRRVVFGGNILARLISWMVLVLLIGCFGCSDHAKHHPDSHSENETSRLAQTGSSELNLSLNGESRWRMDDHTRKLFKQMAARFDGFDASAATSNQLKSLGQSLDHDVKDLIAGCKMVGDAHNELHKYLIVYMPAVNKLRSGGRFEEAQHVRSLLKAYPEYFE